MQMPFPTVGPRPWRLACVQSRMLNALAGHDLAWLMVLPRRSLCLHRQRAGAPSLSTGGSLCLVQSAVFEGKRPMTENNHLLGKVG